MTRTAGAMRQSSRKRQRSDGSTSDAALAALAKSKGDAKSVVTDLSRAELANLVHRLLDWDAERGSSELAQCILDEVACSADGDEGTLRPPLCCTAPRPAPLLPPHPHCAHGPHLSPYCSRRPEPHYRFQTRVAQLHRLQISVMRGENVVHLGRLAKIVEIAPSTELAVLKTNFPCALPVLPDGVHPHDYVYESSMWVLLQYYVTVSRQDSTIGAVDWLEMGDLTEVMLTLDCTWVLTEDIEKLAVVAPYHAVVDDTKPKFKCLPGCSWFYVVARQQVGWPLPAPSNIARAPTRSRARSSLHHRRGERKTRLPTHSLTNVHAGSR